MKLSIIPLSLAFASTAGAFVTAPNIKSVSTTKLEAFKGWQVATAVAGWGLAAQLIFLDVLMLQILADLCDII
jgi:hypothetical protein